MEYIVNKRAKGIGYVYIGDTGLKGGVGGIRIDVEGLINTIVAGYSFLGARIEPSVINSWRPFLNEFASTLASMEIDLAASRTPMSIANLDPGNMRGTFEHIVQRSTQRNVRLENYGVAYNHITNQVREKIRQKQSINIDPSNYPRGSYEISLQPNIFNMLALSNELNRLYAVPVGSNASFDLSRVLNIADVVVTFNSSFSEFERQEKDREQREQERRQERERKEQHMRMIYQVSKEIESIESNFIKIKRQLQQAWDPKALDELKTQHGELTRKLSILDSLSGLDEEVRAQRKLLVNKILALLDETDNLLKQTREEQEKQEREERAKEEEKLLTNPTGHGIRNDEGGLGHFGAPRGFKDGEPRLHEGLDFSTTVGQNIVAPFDGKVMNFKGASKPNYPMLEMYPKKPIPAFDFLQILYVNKPIEVEEKVFRPIKAGDFIGTAADLQDWYSPKVGPHVHVQMFKGKNHIDPTPFFFKKKK